MIKFSDNQRKRMSIIFTNLGIVIFTYSTVGQLFQKEVFNVVFLIFGLCLSLLFFGLAVYFDK